MLVSSLQRKDSKSFLPPPPPSLLPKTGQTEEPNTSIQIPAINLNLNEKETPQHPLGNLTLASITPNSNSLTTSLPLLQNHTTSQTEGSVNAISGNQQFSGNANASSTSIPPLPQTPTQASQQPSSTSNQTAPSIPQGFILKHRTSESREGDLGYRENIPATIPTPQLRGISMEEAGYPRRKFSQFEFEELKHFPEETNHLLDHQLGRFHAPSFDKSYEQLYQTEPGFAQPHPHILPPYYHNPNQYFQGNQPNPQFIQPYFIPQQFPTFNVKNQEPPQPQIQEPLQNLNIPGQPIQMNQFNVTQNYYYNNSANLKNKIPPPILGNPDEAHVPNYQQHDKSEEKDANKPLLVKFDFNKVYPDKSQSAAQSDDSPRKKKKALKNQKESEKVITTTNANQNQLIPPIDYQNIHPSLFNLPKLNSLPALQNQLQLSTVASTQPNSNLLSNSLTNSNIKLESKFDSEQEKLFKENEEMREIHNRFSQPFHKQFLGSGNLNRTFFGGTLPFPYDSLEPEKLGEKLNESVYFQNDLLSLNNMPSTLTNVHSSMEMGERKVGKLTPAERKEKINRYLEKRKRRIWSKKISYDCRKRVADNRLRIKGRFVTKKQAFEILGTTPELLYNNESLKKILSINNNCSIITNTNNIKIRNIQTLFTKSPSKSSTPQSLSQQQNSLSQRLPHTQPQTYQSQSQSQTQSQTQSQQNQSHFTTNEPHNQNTQNSIQNSSLSLNNSISPSTLFKPQSASSQSLVQHGSVPDSGLLLSAGNVNSGNNGIHNLSNSLKVEVVNQNIRDNTVEIKIENLIRQPFHSQNRVSSVYFVGNKGNYVKQFKPPPFKEPMFLVRRESPMLHQHPSLQLNSVFHLPNNEFKLQNEAIRGNFEVNSHHLDDICPMEQFNLDLSDQFLRQHEK
jgi:hypothetical protein